MSWAHFFRLIYVLVYLISTSICSLFGPKVGDPKHVVDPSSLFALINYIFVSSGFLISLLAVAFLTILNKLLSDERMSCKAKAVEGMIALAATTYWALWRLFFVWLDKESGNCNLTESLEKIVHNRTSCVDAGGYWDGLDISGHCFLIALACSFFYDQFVAAVLLIRAKRTSGYPGGTPQLESANLTSRISTPSFYLLPLYYAVLSVGLLIWAAWSSLLLHTSLYFHTIGEKILGLLIGFAFWPAALYSRQHACRSNTSNSS